MLFQLFPDGFLLGAHRSTAFIQAPCQEAKQQTPRQNEIEIFEAHPTDLRSARFLDEAASWNPSDAAPGAGSISSLGHRE